MKWNYLVLICFIWYNETENHIIPVRLDPITITIQCIERESYLVVEIPSNDMSQFAEHATCRPAPVFYMIEHDTRYLNGFFYETSFLMISSTIYSYHFYTFNGSYSSDYNISSTISFTVVVTSSAANITSTI